MSDDDRSILRMLAGNMTEREIAFALHIEPDELSDRLRRIFAELGVVNRDDAVAAAIDRSILEV